MNAADEEKKHETFTVPVNEYPYDRLTSYAKRIVTLLEHPVIEKSDEMKSSLDELLGSIHSLIIAHKLEYEDRIKKKKEDEVEQQHVSHVVRLPPPPEDRHRHPKRRHR